MSDKEFKYGIMETRIAKESWNREKVNSERDHTVSGILMIWRTLHTVCLKAKNRLDEQIEDIKNTYAPNVANEKITALRSEYREFINANAKKYTDHINMVFDEKINEVDKLIAKTANPELVSLIQTINMRSEVSDREWSAIVARVTAAHDYQATRLLADVAEKFNRSFAVPFDPDRRIDDIEEARAELLKTVKILDVNDSDFSYTDMCIVGKYNEPTLKQQKYNQLDHAVGTAAPAKQANLVDRLKEASEIARAKGDNNTANEIVRFLYNNVTRIEDRQVVNAFYKEEAEKLIRKATKDD